MTNKPTDQQPDPDALDAAARAFFGIINDKPGTEGEALDIITGANNPGAGEWEVEQEFPESHTPPLT